MPHLEQMVWGKFTLLWVMVVALSLFCLACSGGAAPGEPETLAAENSSVAVSTQEAPDPPTLETPNPPVVSRLPTTGREAVPEEPTAAPADTPEPVQTTPPGEPPLEPVLQLPNVADTVERVRPAVVSVLAEVVNIGAFGRQTRPSTGTGVIITKDGFVLTNNHVVEGAQEVIITLDDGTLLDAELVGTDRLSDLAVLRLPPGDYSFLPLTSDIEVRVGEWVIAIGNALALPGGPTVTVGVVSALGRSREAIGGTTLNDLIQTDTVMNAGNSGGPLINLRGEIVGINTAVLRSSFGRSLPVEGIGFAVNMETAAQVSTQLINQGRVKWAYMGVGLNDLSAEAVARFNLPFREGAVVSGVGPGTPAHRAGVLPGDIILSLDGKQTATVTDVLRLLRQDLQAGQAVEMEVYRNRATVDLEIVLGERPPG